MTYTDTHTAFHPHTIENTKPNLREARPACNCPVSLENTLPDFLEVRPPAHLGFPISLTTAATLTVKPERLRQFAHVVLCAVVEDVHFEARVVQSGDERPRVPQQGDVLPAHGKVDVDRGRRGTDPRHRPEDLLVVVRHEIFPPRSHDEIFLWQSQKRSKVYMIARGILEEAFRIFRCQVRSVGGGGDSRTYMSPHDGLDKSFKAHRMMKNTLKKQTISHIYVYNIYGCMGLERFDRITKHLTARHVETSCLVMNLPRMTNEKLEKKKRLKSCAGYCPNTLTLCVGPILSRALRGLLRVVADQATTEKLVGGDRGGRRHDDIGQNGHDAPCVPPYACSPSRAPPSHVVLRACMIMPLQVENCSDPRPAVYCSKRTRPPVLLVESVARTHKKGRTHSETQGRT